MTAGTVVITGGILATVILLCIIAVLCYCRLQVSAVAVPHRATKPQQRHCSSGQTAAAGGVSVGFSDL